MPRFQGVPLDSPPAMTAGQLFNGPFPPEEPEEPVSPRFKGTPVTSDAGYINRYTESLTQGPIDEPIMAPVHNLSPLNVPTKMATIGNQAVASLPTDIKERITYFAKQRFPNDPTRMGKYGVQDGRIFYLSDDGNAYFEEPGLSLSPTEMTKYLASGAGPALPAIGGIVGGVATSMAGGLPGAAGGAATGDLVRQGLAMKLAGQENYNAAQPVKEAALSGGGQLAGNIAIKFANRGLARDFMSTKKPEAAKSIARLKSAADELGVPLTPAEITNLRTLRADQNTLGDLPASADIMGDFYTKRNMEQVPNAVSKTLGNISPVQSREVGAQALQSGGKATMEAERKALQEQAAPLYAQSREVKVPNETLEELQKDPVIRRSLRQVMNDPVYQKDLMDAFPVKEVSKNVEYNGGIYGTEKMAEKEILREASAGKLGLYDIVKRQLDGVIAAEESAAKPDLNKIRILKGSRARLVSTLDRLSPEYAQARGIYEEGMPAVTALSKGEVGLAAKKGPTQLRSIPNIIFESGPEAIAKNRAAFVKNGNQAEWDAGLRSYLSDAFNIASKEFKTGNTAPGAGFRARVFGTPEQKQAMKAAMSPEQWGGFNKLMDVLEATGRVPQGGSRTTPMREGIDAMKAESGKWGRRVASVLSPQEIGRNTGKWYEEIMLGKHSEKLANIITSPDSMVKLRELRELPPNSRRAKYITHQLMVGAGFGVLNQPENVAPGELLDNSEDQQ